MSEICLRDSILAEWLSKQDKCYKNYMKLKGFIGIARTFKSGHEITFDDESIRKSCGVNKEKVRSLLVQLGNFREFAVKKLFSLALKKVSDETGKSMREILDTHFFIEAGSTNVTSDYDITISGPYCSQVIEYMFELYYKQFGTVLPVGFDSNLYPGTASYTTIDGLHPDFSTPGQAEGFLHIDLNIGQYGSKTMLLPMVTKTKNGNATVSTLQNYQWACSKLHDGFSELYGTDYMVQVPSGFSVFLNHGQKISSICRNQFCSLVGGEKMSELDSEVRSLRKSYTDMWTHCRTLDSYYREGLNSQLPHERINLTQDLIPYVNTSLGYSNLVAWLCSEAYYSSFTVYAIVVCLQLGYNGAGFIKDVWIVAIIENLADLIKHMLHTISHSEHTHGGADNVTDDAYKKMYITYSKYYYRIYYCLTNYQEMTGETITADASAKLSSLEKALARRKDFNIAQADSDNIWGSDCLNIENIRNPRTWLQNTAVMLMNMLNGFLPSQTPAITMPLAEGVGAYKGAGKRKNKTRKGKHSKKRKRKRKNTSKKRKSRKK